MHHSKASDGIENGVQSPGHLEFLTRLVHYTQ